MRKNHATTEARADAARPCALALERESFVLAAIGLALCISAPEASRYSALWHVSDESSLLGSGLRVAYLLALFLIVRFAAARGHAPLQRNRPLLGALASLQTVGFALLIASSAGWDLPPLAALARSALLDSSLFLFAAFASFYARANAETAISSFVVSVIVAGTVQICLAFLPFPAAAGLVVLFAAARRRPDRGTHPCRTPGKPRSRTPRRRTSPRRTPSQTTPTRPLPAKTPR